MKKPIAILLIIIQFLCLSCSKSEDKKIVLENGGMVMYLDGKSYNFAEKNVQSNYIVKEGHYLFSIVGVVVNIEGAGNNTSVAISVSDNKPIVLSSGAIFKAKNGLEMEFSSYSLI